MGERTSYPPGTFGFAELMTSDADGAKAFYASVFGWEYQDMPMGGEGELYTLVNRDGRQVAGLFASGQPPHWNCYVNVASADESAARVRELGGTLLAEPFDVADLGRTAVIADPTGAAVCVWEPRNHIGAALVNTPGALTWNDLLTPDPQAASRFYEGLFGWTTEEVPDAGGYRLIRNGDRMNGGVQQAPPGAPPAWIPYFGHEDVDRLLGEVGGLGGRVLRGPVQMPQGRIAVLVDPQAAVFAVWTGTYDD